jgi:hypothetical protein
MQVRYFAFVGLVFCLSAQPAYGQKVANKTDRSTIKSCGEPPPEVARMTIWHADKVGVSRLIPEMPGSSDLEIFRYFTGPLPDDILSDEEKYKLDMAKEGIKTSVAYLFFNEPDTKKSVKDPSERFYADLIEAARPMNLRTEYWPCWTVLPAGLTYGTRLKDSNGKLVVDVTPLPGPVALGWYQTGVFTADGKPAAKVSVTKAVTPDQGPYENVPVEICLFDICGNMTGRIAISQTTEVSAPNPPPGSTNPSTPPSPHTSAAAKSTTTSEFRSKPRAVFTVGFGAVFGNVLSTYVGAPRPGTGDASQKNNFTALLPMIRFEQPGNGLFAAGNGTILGGTGKKEFLDAWATKIRDKDDSTDDRLEAMVGWKFGVKGFTLAPFGGWQRICPCEVYDGQGAHTITKRIYQGVVMGAEAIFVSNDGSRWDFRLRGTYGPSLTRVAWTQQTKPGLNYPLVSQPDASGWSMGVRPEFNIKIKGPIYGMVAYDWLGISSRRTNTFQADERVNLNSLVVGVNLRLVR